MSGELLFSFFYGGCLIVLSIWTQNRLKKEFDTYLDEQNAKG